MWRRLALPPIKRLGLMAEHVAGLPRLAAARWTHGHGERIVGVVSCCSHGQADDQRSAFVECARRQNQKRMHISHFVAALRVAIYPDHLLAVGYPAFGATYHCSAPSRSFATMTSPVWRCGSKRASRCSRVSASSRNGVMMMRPPSTVMRTR